jgi:hypothetical protein
MKRISAQRGISLISLMVGIGISAFLLLMVAQLSSIAQQNYIQTQNIIGLYDNAREAIQFLQSNIQVAGQGINQPNAVQNTPLVSSSPNPGGYAVLPDWAYIGYYDEPNPSNRQFNTKVMDLGQTVTPGNCANLMQSDYQNIQFFGNQYCHQCWAPSSVNFDKSTLMMSTNTSTSRCCSTDVGCPGTCGTPAYNCGGTWQNAVYQKLMRHVCITGETHPFNRCDWQNVKLPDMQKGGSALAVVYANPGPTPFITFAGNTVAAEPIQPPSSFVSYIFYVDGTNAVLRATDSANSTTYNIANNIEYMAVLVGESDTLSTYVDSNDRSFYPSLMNRYVQPSVGDLYPYRISAIRVGIVVRTQDPLRLAAPSQAPLNVLQGNDGQWITYTPPTDGRLRKVFTSTIYLNSYTLPDYQAHCTGPSGYIGPSGTYYLKAGGIPFASTWTTNDQCISWREDTCEWTPTGQCVKTGTTNCSPMTWTQCEDFRMQGLVHN